jgi:hypothetical protein
MRYRSGQEPQALTLTVPSHRKSHKTAYFGAIPPQTILSKGFARFSPTLVENPAAGDGNFQYSPLLSILHTR